MRRGSGQHVRQHRQITIRQPHRLALPVHAGEHRIAEHRHRLVVHKHRERERRIVQQEAFLIDVFCERKLGISMPSQANSKH